MTIAVLLSSHEHRSFHLVIVSEQSRLVRNTFEAGPIFDAFLRAEIRVFSYLNGEIRFRTIPEKIMVMMGAGMDEAPVSQTRSRTTDAMLLKAQRGHVTGGKVFGYENAVIKGPDGRKSHVDRRIIPEQAAVVRRIVQMSARGVGYRAIAAALNTEGAPAPRPQQNRPEGWADSTVREVLYRDLYCGNSVYNKTRKKTSAGYRGRSPRPESEWIRVPKPEWRIVDDDLWAAAHEHLNQQRERYHKQRGATQRPNVKDSKYLLTGFCACGECGWAVRQNVRAWLTRPPLRRAILALLGV
jgi:site-specific DNA recombinase